MPCATPWFYCLVRRLLRFACFFYLYNILFFLSIIDKKINIKNKPEQLCLRLLNITCLTILSPIIIINSKMKMVTNECLFMYHLLYQINKFKKIFGDKISYSNAFQFIVYNSFQFIFGNQMNTNNKLSYVFNMLLYEHGQSSIYFSFSQDVVLLLGVVLVSI